jgi:hypothetical protein
MYNLKIKSFRKFSRTADIFSAGHGLYITASILTPPLQEQSLEAIYMVLSARETYIKSRATNYDFSPVTILHETRRSKSFEEQNVPTDINIQLISFPDFVVVTEETLEPEN